MAAKKKTTGRKQATGSEPRPAKRKKIVSLAQYEAEAKPVEQTEPIAAVNETVATKIAPEEKKKRPSGLDAAAQILREAGEPLSTGEMVKRMLERGLWSTGGKTPAATIYAAILREVNLKAADSRFRKTARGHFELTEVGKGGK